jgi:hypothetical protein
MGRMDEKELHLKPDFQRLDFAAALHHHGSSIISEREKRKEKR